MSRNIIQNINYNQHLKSGLVLGNKRPLRECQPQGHEMKEDRWLSYVPVI
jgi:hypothetical protein